MNKKTCVPLRRSTENASTGCPKRPVYKQEPRWQLQVASESFGSSATIAKRLNLRRLLAGSVVRRRVSPHFRLLCSSRGSGPRASPARSAHFCSSRPEGKVVFPRLLFQRTCVSRRSVRQKPRQLSRGELALLFSTACSPVLRGRPAAGVLPGGCCLRWPKGPRGQGLFCLPCRLSAAARQKCTPGCQVAKFSDFGPRARPRGSPSSSSA